ncbi:MAG: RNA polymerase sigma-70 factor [Bacteroidetes bacterium]|nr:MAG: RNA polymerase sigma-70 factor [Bacteroidota bacterium]
MKGKNYIDALEHVFKTHYQALCYAANNIVNDQNAAEDIVQDVFVKLIKKQNAIEITSSLKGYLFKSVFNTALNYSERNKRMLVVEDDILELAAGATCEVDEYLEQVELEDRIARAMNALPPKCRSIFILNRYDDLKYKEIAQHLGISIKTVENQMGKALKKMRLYLRPHILKVASVNSERIP